MAITTIYKIKSTGSKSLKYDTTDKQGKIIAVNKNDSSDSLDYVVRNKNGNIYNLPKEYLDKMQAYIIKNEDKLIFKTISNSLNCSVENAYSEWENVRNIKNPQRGNEGNLQYCIVQNFGMDLNPKIANEIGMKFAKEYLSDYQVVVGTHIDTGYVHNHIEFNATSYIDGKKYNDNRSVINEIRSISDKFCEMYKLDILKNTQKMNLIKFQGDDGKTHFFEPTKRKLEKENLEIAKVNDYRNSKQYKDSQDDKVSHIVILKSDMDKNIAKAKTYNEFLELMNLSDYQIKDKTKDGSWRKYISFKKSDWEKFIRDYTVGEEYKREYLENIFENRVAEHIIEYDNKDTHAIVNNNKENLKVYIEKDVANLNSELESYKEVEIKQKTKFNKKQYLINRINQNLNTIKFVEKNNITEFNSIYNKVDQLITSYNNVSNTLEKIANTLKKANECVTVIEKYNSLEFSYDERKEVFKNYLIDKNLLDKTDRESFINNYNEYKHRYEKLIHLMNSIKYSIKEYDSCVSTINIIDKNYHTYDNEIKQYYKLKGLLNTSKTNIINEDYRKNIEKEKDQDGRKER